MLLRNVIKRFILIYKYNSSYKINVKSVGGIVMVAATSGRVSSLRITKALRILFSSLSGSSCFCSVFVPFSVTLTSIL